MECWFKSKKKKKKLPFLPSCTYEKLENLLWNCESLYYNSYPYEDIKRCESNVVIRSFCLKSVARLCLKGNATILLQAYNPNITPEEKFTYLQKVSEAIIGNFQKSILIRDCDHQVLKRSVVNRSFPYSSFLSSFKSFNEENEELINKIYTTKNKYTFCRLLDEFQQHIVRSQENLKKKIERTLNNLSVPENIKEYNIELIKRILATNKAILPQRKLAQCMAISQMEYELHADEHIHKLFLDSKTKNGCKELSLDVQFAIDGTKKLSKKQFSSILNLLTNVTNCFNLKKNQFGLIQFSDIYKNKSKKEDFLSVEFQLGEHKWHTEISEAFNNVHQKRKRKMYLAPVFHLAYENFRKSSKFSNICTKKVLVLFTLGRFKDRTQSFFEAAKLRRNDIILISLELGSKNFNLNQYSKLINGNIRSHKNMFRLQNFNDLFEFEKSLVDKLKKILEGSDQ